MEKFTKKKIAEQYHDDFPKMSTLQLARIMLKENNKVFLDIENARSVLRMVRGEHGKGKLPFKSRDAKDKVNNSLLKLPETWADEKKIFIFPKGNDKIGFISDCQVPFHDVQSMEVSIDWLLAKGINTLLINGDFIDFYNLSNFQKDPRKRDFDAEYDTIIAALEWIKEKCKNIDVYYNLDANHELRWWWYMQKKAPELLRIVRRKEMDDYFSLSSLLQLERIGIRPITGYSHIQLGKLLCVHGHTLFRGATSPVSPARTVFMKTKQSCIASHCHRTSEYSATTLDGGIITTWTTGCLMSLNVEYNPHGNDYNHGFAYIEVEKDGGYRVENKRIFNGKVL